MGKTMARDGYRSAFIKAMANAIWHTNHGYDGGFAQATAAFDAIQMVQFQVLRDPFKELLKFSRASGADTRMLNRITFAWHTISGEWL